MRWRVLLLIAHKEEATEPAATALFGLQRDNVVRSLLCRHAQGRSVREMQRNDRPATGDKEYVFERALIKVLPDGCSGSHNSLAAVRTLLGKREMSSHL